MDSWTRVPLMPSKKSSASAMLFEMRSYVDLSGE